MQLADGDIVKIITIAKCFIDSSMDVSLFVVLDFNALLWRHLS